MTHLFAIGHVRSIDDLKWKFLTGKEFQDAQGNIKTYWDIKEGTKVQLTYYGDIKLVPLHHVPTPRYSQRASRAIKHVTQKTKLSLVITR